MVVDVGLVKNHIKPKADSTLYNMRKVDLIEYIRTLEHNYNVAVSFNENQAKYIESLGITKVVRCKDCKHYENVCGCYYCFHPKIEAGWNSEGGESLVMDAMDFCSYGERKDNDF